MVAIIVTTAVAVIFFFFNSVVYAKGYGSRLCNSSSQYSCYVVKRGDTWQKLFPDAEKRDLVMRINRKNTRLYPGLRIAIPNSDHTDLMAHSPLPERISPPGRKMIIIDIDDLAFGAYDADGHLQHWGPISGGRGYCPDVRRRCSTPIGKFAIYQKRGAGCVSSKFPVGRGGAPMPYCMFFRGGFALHGSYTVPGYHDSHGCIRLFVNDAKWLNQDFTAGSSTSVLIRK